MAELETLLYRSRIEGRDPTRDLREILQASIWPNAKHQVTGMLARSGRHYVQVLEGKAPALDRLYRNLQRDPRHSDVELLLRGPIAARRFPGWSAALDDTDPWGLQAENQDPETIIGGLAIIARRGRSSVR